MEKLIFKMFILINNGNKLGRMKKLIKLEM